MDPAAGVECAICLEIVNPKPADRVGLQKRILEDCNHIFHRECIGEWIKRKDHCPMCWTTIVNISEEPRKEKSPEEILALDSVSEEQVMREGREVIWLDRRFKVLDLNANAQVAQIARKFRSLVFQH